MAWTADDLVAAVRRRAQLPDESADGAIDDADILMLADEELSLRLVPLVRSCRGDYWVMSEDAAIAQGQAAYRVPERAQTSGLREVTVIDSGGVAYPIPQIATEDAWRWQQPANGIVGSMRNAAFFMEGANLVIVPTPSDSSWTLRMRYYRAMSKLVPNADTGSVQWLGGPDGECTLYEFPAAWLEPPVSLYGMIADVYHQKPPFGIQAMDVAMGPITGITTLIPSAPTNGMVAGAVYGIAHASQTSVVDLPRECWPLFVSAVTARVMDVIGDRDGAKLEYALYAQEAANVTLLLTPRIEGNKIRIVDRNSLLRSRRRW